MDFGFAAPYNTGMDGFAFLDSGSKKTLQPLYVLHGDEHFLKRQVLLVLRGLAFGTASGDFDFSTHEGDKAEFAAVHDELQTIPFSSPRRLVVVENADPFVTRWRSTLEKYVEALAGRKTIAGVLVLDVRTWTASTRLAKMVESSRVITCKAPANHRVPAWCVKWCKARHDKELNAAAARMLVDLVGGDMGQLDQELEKLSVYVGAASRIEARDVDELVGRSQSASIFKIFEQLSLGRPGEALTNLERHFDLGEEPIRMLGAFSLQLRRLAQTARLQQQGLSFYAAAEEAGLPPFARQECERQLRLLGRRTDQLYDWLLEADLGMKGSSPLSPRTLLERLIVRLA